MAYNFNLDPHIRRVPDFPKPGVLFYDITSVLANPEAFLYCIDCFEDYARNLKVDAIAPIESRGFIFAGALAERLSLPIILVRKKGKLPGRTAAKSYSLEYGQAEIEVHVEDVPKGGRILIVDDLIATGGTVRAVSQLLSENGAIPVALAAVIGLPFLNYAASLDIPVKTLIDFHAE